MRTMNSLLAWLYFYWNCAFVLDWDEVPPSHRLPTLAFMVVLGLVMGLIGIMFLAWLDSVML